MNKKKVILTILMIPVVGILFLFTLYGTWFISIMNGPTQSNAAFTGSKNCQECHAEIYQSWAATPHANAVQDVTAEHNPIIPEWKGTHIVQEGDGRPVTIKLNKTPEGVHQMILVDAENPSFEVTYDVRRTHGGWKWKQFYSTKIGGEYYILPLAWYQISKKWGPFLLQLWWNRDGSLDNNRRRFFSFGNLCSGCHNTGLVLTFGATGYQKSNYVDINIACEKCHGPGRKHAEDATPETIINPKSLPFEKQVELCGQCHTVGKSYPIGVLPYAIKEFGGNVYRMGKPLKDYFKTDPILWEGTKFSKKHRQQYNEILISKHYRAKVGCFECHDIHGTQHISNLKEPIDNNALCLSCHKKNEKFASATAIETHTKHPYDPEKSGSSRCTSCHLQRSTFNSFLGDGPSHHFQIVTPELSLTMFEKYEDDDPLPDYCKEKEGALGYKSLVYCYSQTVIPNSCNGCHKEWGANRKGYEASIQAFNKKFQ